MKIPKLRNSRFDEQKLLLFILRSASGTLALRVFSMGTIFITRVVLARALGIEEFGVFSYALTWLDLLAIAGVFGADRMILRELAIYRTQENWAHAKGVIRFGILLSTFLSLAIMAVAQIILWLSQQQRSLHLSRAFMGAPEFPFPITNGAYLTIAVILIALPLLSVIRVSRAILQALQHVVIGQIPEYGLRPLLYLVALVLVGALFSTWHLTAWRSLLLYNLTVLIGAVVSVLLLRRYTPATFTNISAHYRYRGWSSALLPLALLEGAYFINGRIAAIVLGLLANSTQVSLYTVAERIMTLLALILYATNYALAPHFARLYTQENWRQLQLITTWGARGVFFIASIAGIVFMVFIDPILALFGTEFVAAKPILFILIMGQLFNAFTGSVSVLLTTTYHEHETMRAVAISAVLNLIVNAILIPEHGAVGAALASTLSLVYWNIHLVIYARLSLGIDTTALGIFAKKWNKTT